MDRSKQSEYLSRIAQLNVSEKHKSVLVRWATTIKRCTHCRRVYNVLDNIGSWHCRRPIKGPKGNTVYIRCDHMSDKKGGWKREDSVVLKTHICATLKLNVHRRAIQDSSIDVVPFVYKNNKLYLKACKDKFIVIARQDWRRQRKILQKNQLIQVQKEIQQKNFEQKRIQREYATSHGYGSAQARREKLSNTLSHSVFSDEKTRRANDKVLRGLLV